MARLLLILLVLPFAQAQPAAPAPIGHETVKSVMAANADAPSIVVDCRPPAANELGLQADCAILANP